MVDLALAPRNERGEVVFTADVFILKPVDLRRGNGRVYYEVPNRGGKGVLRRLQYAEASLDPREPADFGDGWLMEQGFALVWMGWQWDVPEQPGLLRLRAPIATDGGRPIEGLVRSVVIVGERQDEAPLADSSHLAYPPVDPEGRDSRLYRAGPPPGRPAPAAEEDLALRRAVEGRPRRRLRAGAHLRGRLPQPRPARRRLRPRRHARPGQLLQERGRSAANPLAGVTLALGHGISQSGRFLRHFLHQGFNEDEQGRRVFDGVFVEVAGAGRGSFNHRFAQASRDGHQHWNVHYPTDVFPFTDRPETDPETGETAGLLDREVASGTVPRLFHVVTSYEYWNRAASLMHTDPSGTRDVAFPDTSRAYLVASAQHGPGTLPPAEGGANGNDGLHPRTPTTFVRRSGRSSAPSTAGWPRASSRRRARYPRIGDGTLAPPERAGWPSVPGVRFPTVRNEPVRTDYGPEWARGVITIEPPRLGRVFPALVPAVDADGNDRAGIRLPEIAAPLASQTGWNWRHPRVGAPDALVAYRGSYLPFAWTKAEREAKGDPRLSVEERYRGREDYLGRVALAATGARARALPAPAGRALRHRAGRRPLGLAQRERPRRLIAPPSRGRRPCRARRAASDRRAGRRSGSRSGPRPSCPSPSTRG